jgi:hypothetical protein
LCSTPAIAAGLRFDAKWLVIGVAVALVAWLSLLPLGFLLWQSILSPQSAGASAQLTLQNYLDAYSGFETYRLSFNSLQFAFGAAIVSFLIGTFFAWINERTNTPCKTLFFALSIIPLIIPGIYSRSHGFFGEPENRHHQRCCKAGSAPISFSSTSIPWRDDLVDGCIIRRWPSC